MLNTTESIHRRTGPVVVKWLTPAGVEQPRQFDTLDNALEFARQFGGQQRLSLRIEFPTSGEAMHYDEIAERLGWI